MPSGPTPPIPNDTTTDPVSYPDQHLGDRVCQERFDERAGDHRWAHDDERDNHRPLAALQVSNNARGYFCAEDRQFADPAENHQLEWLEVEIGNKAQKQQGRNAANANRRSSSVNRVMRAACSAGVLTR
jgi:hypothetical protein